MYIGKLNWLASNTRPDISLNAMNSARSQKSASLKYFRDINRTLKKFLEKENKVVSRKVGVAGENDVGQ